MNNNLKKIFISGSTKGVGFGIAKALSERGYAVIINGRNSGTIKSCLTQLNESCAGIEGDVTDLNDLKKIYKFIENKFGGLNGIVTNVGSGKSARPGEETFFDWDDSMGINFYSAIKTIGILKKLLRDQASIVCISSICGVERIEGAPITYSVAKAALNHFIRCSAPAFAESEIRINGIAPGNIMFPGSTWEEKFVASEATVKSMLDEKVPMRRFGTTKDVGLLVAYLMSSDASFITGSVYTIDGGQTH
jgi:3-oxoacyl-[acyl-carrier protein] reductase